MKNPFKRNRKPEPEPGHANARCFIIGIDEAKESLADLAKLGRYVRVEHFPENVHAPGKAPWVLTFDVRLEDAQGTHYGHKGVEIINAVGLPGGLKNVVLIAEDNGRAVVKVQTCPPPSAIEHLARTIEARATLVLDEYRRFEAMGKVRKGVAK